MGSPTRIRRRSTSSDYSRRRRSPSRGRRSPVRRRYSPARNRSLRRGSDSPVRRRSSPVRRNLNRSRRVSSSSSSASSSMSSSRSSSPSRSRSSSSDSSSRSNLNRKNNSSRIKETTKDSNTTSVNNRETASNKVDTVKDTSSSKTTNSANMNAIRIVSLSVSVKKDHLKEIFSTFGEIKSINLPLQERVNASKGYAYIEYQDAMGAKNAYEAMNQGQIDGQFIGINLCDQEIIRKYEADSDLESEIKRARATSPHNNRSSNRERNFRDDRSFERDQRSNTRRGPASPRRTSNGMAESRNKVNRRVGASNSSSGDNFPANKGRALLKGSISRSTSKSSHSGSSRSSS